MSKKWKIALVVLVVIVVFCCWYTRPRSLDALVGEGKITSIALLAQVGRVGDNGKAFIDTWQVESNGERGYVNSGLEEIFKSCQYRVSLRSLFPFPSHDKIYGKEGAPVLLVSAAIENETGFNAAAGRLSNSPLEGERYSPRRRMMRSGKSCWRIPRNSGGKRNTNCCLIFKIYKY